MLEGRDRERRLIGELLDGARAARSGALVVRGEAGSGKTALLEDTRGRATDMHVLSVSGVESEADLPFAALQALMRPALDRLDAIPEPQAQAVRGALGMAADQDHGRFLVYTGCLSLLAELAERRPVLCLVDDAQWLDTASAEAVGFIGRRLGAEGVVLLLGAREGDVRTFDGDGLPSLRLDGLAADAAGALLDRVAPGAATAVRERLVAQARGNPLAIVELPRLLSPGQLRGDEPLPDDLPTTGRIEESYRRRAATLPADTRRLLLVASADDSGDLDLVLRASAGFGADPAALERAEQEGLLAVHGARIAFRHPLMRSAVYASATSGERRDAHRALAGILDGDDAQADRRAWHLAAAAVDGDPAAVTELDLAAARAEERGGHVAAARALERAAELSRDPAERARRFVWAALDLSVAGRDERAVAMLERADGLPLDAAGRAESARVRAQAAVHRHGRLPGLLPELTQAAVELARTDPEAAVDLMMLATAASWQGGDRDSQLRVADVAATIPLDGMPEDSDAVIVADSIAGFAAMLRGTPELGVPALSRTVVWGADVDDPRNAIWASWAALWLGDQEGWEDLVRHAADVARARGELGALGDALGLIAVHLALIAQSYDEAAVAASEALDLAREIEAPNLHMLPEAALAVVAAVRGRLDEARSRAERVLATAETTGLHLRGSPARYALALADMAQGRWDAAADRLGGFTDAMDPARGVTAPDRIECAVRAGRVDEAREVLAFYEVWSARSPSPAAAARRACCRALVGDGPADADLDAALGLAGTAHPFDRGRIRLIAGEYLRRARRPADARPHLRQATEDFDAIGAEPWAERARQELRATGESARRRTPDARAGLTPQELQIARLVARGYTNKEVAAQLFLSPRTIDAHLRGVFSKLGITSRRELRDIPLGELPAEAADAPPDG